MLGVRLATLRKEKKKTQKEMAEYLGITRPAYTAYERGNRHPDYEMLNKLADYFGVQTDYLLGRTDKREVSSPDDKLSKKDERDIAKRMEKLREDLTKGDGLCFHGEPISEEAIESLLDAIEYAERQATRINKKYIPKKYRKETND